MELVDAAAKIAARPRPERGRDREPRVRRLEEDAGRGEGMQTEEAGRRQEGERDQDQAGIAEAPCGDVGDIRQDDADKGGAEHQPEVARMVLPLEIHLRPSEEHRQPDERQRDRDRDRPRDSSRLLPRLGIRRHARSIRPGHVMPSSPMHHHEVTDQILSPRALNRALLARQSLLERSTLSIAEAVEQVGGLQTQYAPSGYVGLWTRLAGFQRDDLTAALEDRSVVQATLMRVTIHIVSRARVLAVRARCPCRAGASSGGGRGPGRPG